MVAFLPQLLEYIKVLFVELLEFFLIFELTTGCFCNHLVAVFVHHIKCTSYSITRTLGSLPNHIISVCSFTINNGSHDHSSGDTCNTLGCAYGSAAIPSFVEIELRRVCFSRCVMCGIFNSGLTSKKCVDFFLLRQFAL